MSRILRHVGNKDFKRTRQRQVDEQRYIAAKKLKELQEAEEERRQVEEIARPYKSDWREETQLQESDWTPVAGSIANSTAQTFQYGGFGGPQATFSGLGGVEAVPSTVTIDYGFGETEVVSAPDFSQLGLQGYAPPLANIQRKTDQEEDERIDAEIRKLEEQIKQLTEQQNDLFEEETSTEPEYTGWSEAEYTDKVNEINGKYSDILAPYFKNMTGKFGTGFGTASDAERKRAYAKAAELEPAHTAELNNLAAEYKSQTDAFVKAQDAHRAAYDKRNLTLEAQKDTLNAKIVKLEKQRPINKQLDASQQAYPNLPLMNARVQSAVGTGQGDYRNDTSLNYDRVRDTVLDTLASVANLDTAKNALRSYNDFLANPKGAGSSPNNPLDISNQVSDRDMSALRDAANSGAVRSAIDFAKQKNTSLAWNTAADSLEARLNVVTTQTPGLNNTVKGTGTLDRERFIQSNGEDIRLNKTYAFRPGGSIANLEKSLLGKGLSALGIKLDTLGAGGISNIAGPVASSAMLTNLKGDLYNAPAANMQIKVDMSRPLNTSTPVSGRGAGRSSFPTSDANSFGQRGSDGGMTDDSMGGLPQPGDSGYVNPNVLGRLARSATDSTRYSGNMMFQGNPAGRAPGLSNFWSPDPSVAGTYSNPGNVKGIPGTRPNPTGTLTTAPRPRNVPRVTRGLSGTPQFKFPKGQVPPSNMFTQTADDAAVKAAQNAAQKSGGKTLSKFLARAIPFANAALAGADAGNRVKQGDYFGAALGAATAIPGPAGWAALGGQMAYDAAGRPFMGAPATTPTSGRGAGRSSFSTSDGNVVPKANKGFASDPKTGEPRYTGMNDRQYSDATNKIADKYNKLRAPIERQYAEFSGQQAPASLMNKLNALNDAQTAEEDALRAARAAQENAFNDALQDYNDKQDAANQARQDALDEIDNEEDPYSKLLAELGAKMEKLRREGRLIARYKILGPGDKGYVDTTKMANSIGYNRVPIYTAAAKELQKQILAAQDAQMEWYNDRDKRREDAEKADYSDAGGSSGKGGRKGGQGGLPLGTTSLRSGGARQGVAPENKSQSAALARQAASARMNPQQRRKRGMKESTTWSRLKKHLSEGMTTANMGAVYYSGEGHVDLATAVSDFTLSGPSGHGWNSVTKNLGSDRSKYDTIVVTVNSNSAEWEVIDGGYNTNFRALGSGGTGNYTFVIPRIYGALYYTARDNGSISFSTKYQRRTPLNVFVPLDDPDANAFIKDGSTDNLSRAQKKKKLEDQLKSSENYLNGKYSEGMPKGVTQIKDYEPQQSFANIAAAPQQGPLPPGPRGYRRPGTYDPNKFYNLAPGSLPSPNIPPTGPGYSKGIDGTKVAASYPTTNTPLDKVGGFKGIPKGKGIYPMDKDGNLYNPQTGLPIKKAGRKQRTMVAHHELVGKVLSEKKSIKSRNSIVDKIRGYYDGKPSPLGFPVEEPPKMVNGYHPDLVDGKKVANRFNRLDPTSARAMPKTGNPHIDKKVKVARKKPK